MNSKRSFFFLIVIIIFPFILLLLLIYNSMSKERMSYVFFFQVGEVLFSYVFPSFMWLKSSIYLVMNLQMAIGLAMPDWFLLQWRSPSFPYRTQHPMTTSVWCRIVREFFLKKKRNKKETKIIQNKQNTRKKTNKHDKKIDLKKNIMGSTAKETFSHKWEKTKYSEFCFYFQNCVKDCLE